MNEYLFRQLAYLLKVDVFLADKEQLISFQEHEEFSPLYQDAALREELMTWADQQELPYVKKDEYSVFFACIRHEGRYYLLGPMATEYLNISKRHAFYRKHQIEKDLERNLHRFNYMDMLQTVNTFCNAVTGKEYSDSDLVWANHLVEVTSTATQEESIRFSLASDEEDMYRHTYQEERKLLDSVKDGDPDEALRRVKVLDGQIGKLAEGDIQHLKNLLVIGATLCARAAIEGGVAPYVAYRISGFYINKGSASSTPLHIIRYRNEAVEKLAGRVRELKEKKHTSSYTMQCKDYVNKHFREKIYLDEIAQKLEISSSYLSRTFKRETGQQFQDYVADVRVERAANLLIYSDESLSNIAAYVNFPSQSYFGRVFKERMHMTPREYREKNKPKEFIDQN